MLNKIVPASVSKPAMYPKTSPADNSATSQDGPEDCLKRKWTIDNGAINRKREIIFEHNLCIFQNYYIRHAGFDKDFHFVKFVAAVNHIIKNNISDRNCRQFLQLNWL